MFKKHVDKLLIGNARILRNRQTDAEKVMWEILRNKQAGSKFRRQHPIGKYVVDFAVLIKN